ncbi:DUF4181 domain-containing protein [Bacillus sp. FJAT-45350]|uniref:DUF4181 domain-containing protein n=1 Tax=Bacillus sp. FJAT-45350 TaxID=2011014 RepID=UPI000BB89BF0|nr:DUF4181 domain-containing protein [Bacillus sp. FJAT-45350]
MYGIESTFLLSILLFLAILLLIVSFNKIMRKWLKVEKEKLFSYNHVNEKHKKIDWTIRIVALVFFLLGYVVNTIRESIHELFQPWFLLLIIIVSEAVKAVMERKYAENPNAYKLTISQIIFVLVLLFTLYKTDFFGLV